MQLRIQGKDCKKCGAEGIPFYTRKKRGRLSVSGHCILCEKEDAGIRNRRCWRKNKKTHARRTKEWRTRNRQEYNASQREWYQKNKYRINEAKRMAHQLKSKVKKRRIPFWKFSKTSKRWGGNFNFKSKFLDLDNEIKLKGCHKMRRSFTIQVDG